MTGNFEEVIKRIKQTTSARTQIDLATILGIRQSSISDAKRRGTVPSAWLVKLFEKYQLNPNWLTKGIGPVYLRAAQAAYEGADDHTALGMAEPASEYASGAPMISSGVEAPLYATHMESGAGTWSPVQTGMVAIPKQFYRPNIMVVAIDSAGMEPIIHKYAYVGIDGGQKNILSGEIYAFSIPFEGLAVKRVFLNPDQRSLALRGENRDYPEITMPLEGVDSKVIGRVIWVMQNI